MTPPPSEATENANIPSDLLARAVELHRAGKLREAEPLYAAVLAAEPDHPDALHFLGVLRHRQGQSGEGMALVRRSLALVPDNPDAHNNLGNILLESGDAAEAAAAYRRVVELRPDSAEAQHNLGVALRHLARTAEAEAAIEAAIALDPRNPVFHYNLALHWLQLRRPLDAIPILQVALVLDPDFAQAHQTLVRAIRLASGRPADALKAIGEWLAHDPDNPIALHFRAAYSGEGIPARASDAYVQSTFDKYAAGFDAHLDRLGYKAPQLLAAAIAGFLGAPAAALEVLDAGCGTGLCGPLLKPFACRLLGVDLAQAMLAKARERDIYDELAQGELTAFLESHANAFDLVLSADTLVYFGDLAPVTRAAARALRSGGLLAFTLERLDADEPRGYRLEEHGRYAHRSDYVLRVLDEAGLSLAALEQIVPRNEAGQPVAGLLVVARRTASGDQAKA
jgi:predicted TPR repeat methyltransferase